MNPVPDSKGYFGKYGGRFVPETLMEALLELERQYAKVYETDAFQNELDQMLLIFARTVQHHFILRTGFRSELKIGKYLLKT